MPQFLTNSGTSHLIENIIIKAKSDLVLITPYLKLSRILSERLVEANDLGVKIKLVYGKSELRPRERQQLDMLHNLELLYLENLHAKCYHNESTLIVSPMNLYEFSEKNNREMSIVLTQRDDKECFADALAEARSIIAAARASIRATDTFAKQPVVVLQSNTNGALTTGKQFDHNLKAQKLHELLSRNPSYSTIQFQIESRPQLSGEGTRTTIIAEGFPRLGVTLRYEGSIRLEFGSSYNYQRIKNQLEATFNRILGDYRCYWNRDVIQIYAAKSYEYTDEQTVAAHYMQEIEKARFVLKNA
ncbi:phospholipase D-like domain-containing protein [Hymenobacter sp. 102]|uniref:phospholipase D-like domain-containing protein n=1 Tax=Hymenobacter sp. 102 TaxID=3403152 RepID=UPI003CF198AF